MADSIHYILSNFRETMLTAIAKLEFELRDTVRYSEPVKQKYPPRDHWLNEEGSEISDVRDTEVEHLAKTVELVLQRLDQLETTQKSCTTSVCKEDVHEILQIKPIINTKNIIVPSVKSTPALAAAVAAASANPPIFTLDSNQTNESFSIINDISKEKRVENDEDSEDEEEIIEEAAEEAVEEVEEEAVEEVEEEAAEEVEEEAVEEVEEEAAEEVEEEAAEEETVETVVEETEEVDQEESPDLEPIKIKGKQYYKDSENNIYAETEDGYEQIGIYNPKTKEIEVEETVEEAEEEEGVEVEEFEYKGKTYQRDTENNVYLDGEQIGTWNGKKIIPT
jgi:hypothetical protein